MDETLLEFVDSRDARLAVDRSVGVIRGVKILGLVSRNARVYLPEALSSAIHLYEGSKVNVNHPRGNPQGPRDYQDRIGVIRNVALREGDGLFGDLHYNPQHALAGQLAWDAEHAPENVGLSHNVQARLGTRGDQAVVEAILKVQSVDLVADPATTRGLFEAAEAGAIAWSDVTLEQLAERRPDLAQLLEARFAGPLAELQIQVDRFRADEAARAKRTLAERLLVEHKLPPPASHDPWARWITSDTFWQAVLAAEDEPAMRRLITERAQLVQSARLWPGAQQRSTSQPLAREQSRVESPWPQKTDARGFVQAIT